MRPSSAFATAKYRWSRSACRPAASASTWSRPIPSATTIRGGTRPSSTRRPTAPTGSARTSPCSSTNWSQRARLKRKFSRCRNANRNWLRASTAKAASRISRRSTKTPFANCWPEIERRVTPATSAKGRDNPARASSRALQHLLEHDGVVAFPVLGGRQQRQAVVFGHPREPAEFIIDLAKFFGVLVAKLPPSAVNVLVEPLSQFIRRRNRLAPLVQSGVLLGYPARPDPIDQHPATVVSGRVVIDSLELDHRPPDCSSVLGCYQCGACVTNQRCCFLRAGYCINAGKALQYAADWRGAGVVERARLESECTGRVMPIAVPRVRTEAPAELTRPDAKGDRRARRASNRRLRSNPALSRSARIACAGCPSPGAYNSKKFHGEVPEWSNGLAWKVSVRVEPYRGFESLPLRQYQQDRIRRGGRVVECTGLENRQGFTPFVGSNPTLSARYEQPRLRGVFRI